jgi:hypothetical protein
LAKSSANLITSSAIAKQHAAAIVDSKMVVFGGDSGHNLLDDTRVLGFFFPCCCLDLELCTEQYRVIHQLTFLFSFCY